MKVRGYAIFFGALIAAPSCKSNDSEKATARAENAPASAVADPGPATKADPADSECPAGTWEYDYSDQFLESMTKTATQNIEVVKETGKVVCTITGRDKGSYDCKASEGGVENVLRAQMGNAKMEISVKIDGSSKVTYESAGPNKWRTTGGDFDNLKASATAKVGDRAVPMPAFQLFRGWNEKGSVLEYQCKDGMLLLKPEAAKSGSEWLHLKPLK